MPTLKDLLDKPFVPNAIVHNSGLIAELDAFAHDPTQSVADRAAAVRHQTKVIGLVPDDMLASLDDAALLANFLDDRGEFFGAYDG